MNSDSPRAPSRSARARTPTQSHVVGLEPRDGGRLHLHLAPPVGGKTPRTKHCRPTDPHHPDSWMRLPQPQMPPDYPTMTHAPTTAPPNSPGHQQRSAHAASARAARWPPVREVAELDLGRGSPPPPPHAGMPRHTPDKQPPTPPHQGTTDRPQTHHPGEPRGSTRCCSPAPAHREEGKEAPPPLTPAGLCP